MNELNFNIFNILIFAGIVHGFGFSLIIFFNKKLSSVTNYFLAFTILALALSNLQYWFIDTGIIPKYKYEDKSLLFIPFEFLILPFFYFFVKNYLNRKVSKAEYIYMFIPFILCIAYLLVHDVVDTKLGFFKTLNLIVEYISVFFSILLIILIFYIIYSYEKEHSKYSVSKINIKTKWLKRSLVLGLLLCVLWFVSLNIFKDAFGKGYYKFYPLWIGIATLIYWISYVSIFKKNLYKQRKEIRTKRLKKSGIPDKTNAKGVDSFSKIETYIVENRAFLNPKISLKSLSKEMNLSEGYISQLININSSLNFNEFINSLRVIEAKQMIEDNTFDSYTITAIGLESGFNSKSSFYAAFKKFTNKTPIDYKKSVRNL